MDARAFRFDREDQILRLSDGRLLGHAEYGDPKGYPVFAFHGTPGCRHMFRLADPLAREQGFRLIAPDRPGYSLSSPLPSRSLSDWPKDVEALADDLEIDRFAVIGVSGGGPYAAATAALLVDRVSGAALVSPVGPVGMPDLEPLLSSEHRRIFLQLARSPRLARTVFTTMRIAVTYTPTLALRGLMTRAADVDRNILMRPEIGSNLIESMTEGLVDGISGPSRDLHLFVEPWDFEFTRISAPCKVWQGDVDRNVPHVAARCLADQIPDCLFETLPETGHYWVYEHFDKVLAWIAATVRIASDAEDSN